MFPFGFNHSWLKQVQTRPKAGDRVLFVISAFMSRATCTRQYRSRFPKYWIYLNRLRPSVCVSPGGLDLDTWILKQSGMFYEISENTGVFITFRRSTKYSVALYLQSKGIMWSARLSVRIIRVGGKP